MTNDTKSDNEARECETKHLQDKKEPKGQTGIDELGQKKIKASLMAKRTDYRELNGIKET